MTDDPTSKPFGSVFAPRMAMCRFLDGAWQPWTMQDTAPIPMHPAAHVFHYASCCFEGLKAYRWESGDIRLFRMDRNVARMRQSAELLQLPVPETDSLADMIRGTVLENATAIPDAPGSLYLRPTLIGTEPNIGKAAGGSGEALLYILASPVGDYFKGGIRPLKVLIDDENPRSTPEFGMAKAGANYAQALRTITSAKQELGADQVLFAPDDDVQETGAANFLMIKDGEVITRDLDGAFLHGVTRDSILTIARDLGYTVNERRFGVQELMDFTTGGEAGLTGTAAVFAPIGELLYKGKTHLVGDGGVGPDVTRLRQALVDLQSGHGEDTHGWLTAP